MKTQKVGCYVHDKTNDFCPGCNATQTPHTPTPWEAIGEEIVSIKGSDGSFVVSEMTAKSNRINVSAEANAAFIVRAVNFHQVLLNIARNLHYEHHPDLKTGCETCETIANAEAV